MVSSFPGAVLGEVTLDPYSSKCICSNINGNAQVVTRKSYMLHAMCILLLEIPDVQKADILEGNGIAGSAIVKHQALLGPAFAFFPKGYDLLDFLFCGHTCRDVDFTIIFITQDF